MPVLLLKRNPIIIFGCYTQDAVTLQGLHSGWNSYERSTSDRYLFLFHTRWKLEFELPVEGKQALSNCKLREINSPPSILELCNNTLRIICLLPVSSPQCKSLSRHIEDIISCVVLWPGGFEPIGISSSWALRAKSNRVLSNTHDAILEVLWSLKNSNNLNFSELLFICTVYIMLFLLYFN